jgi:Sulfotransferase family
MMPFGSRKSLDMLREAKASLNAAVGALRSKTSKQSRRQLAIKEAQIAALRRELARVRGDGYPQRPVVEDTPVFFILGQQKSGTTWLMQILDSHPEILCSGEGRFFGADWRQESVKRIDSKRPPSSLYNAMLDAEYLKLWIERSVWSRNDEADEHLANLTRMAIDYFLMGELSKTSKRIVGDKSPLLTPGTIKEIARIYPAAKIIHIIRDGRDAAVSAVHHSWNFGKIRKGDEASAKRTTDRKRDPHEMRNMGESIFAEGQLRKFAAEWSARVSRTVEDGPALLGNGYVEVRYEDLLERPEEEVRRLLEYLRAEASEKTVKMCVNAASFKKLSKGRTRGQEDPTSFFRKGIAGDWRNVFTEQDKVLFKKEAGDLLIRLGYEKDDSW